MKYLTLFSLLFIQLLVFGQARNQPITVVAATRNNFIYRNVSNQLSIAVPGCYDKDIVAKTSVGKIEHFENSSNYELNIGLCLEQSVTISVYLKKPNKKLQLVGEHKFIIRNWPKPNIRLGSIDYDGLTTYDRLNASNWISAIQTCFTVCEIGYTIKAFYVKHKHKDGSISIYKSEGNLLTNEIKQSFKNAEDNDTIMIYDVLVAGPNGTERLDDELILVVKKI